jgi:hypothetical protein
VIFNLIEIPEVGDLRFDADFVTVFNQNLNAISEATLEVQTLARGIDCFESKKQTMKPLLKLWKEYKSISKRMVYNQKYGWVTSNSVDDPQYATKTESQKQSCRREQREVLLREQELLISASYYYCTRAKLSLQPSIPQFKRVAM